MDAPLRAKIRYLHDRHYISKDESDSITDADINAAIDETVELIQQEIAKARIDELEKVAAVSSENVDRLPDEPDYPKNLAVKSAVDEYNKKSSEYIDAYFWFDMAFQPIHTYKRSRITELSKTLKEHKEA